MAPHERVFVDRAFAEDENHGDMDCAECHGGNPEAPGFEAAHEGVVRDPSAADGSGACGDCHDEIAAVARTSLHVTLEPYRRMTEARAGDDAHVRAKLAGARQANCESCHASCGQCHVSRPASVGGGLLQRHLFQKKPPMRQTCTACHGSRIEKEYFGQNEGVKADVHRFKRMECQACHTGAEMHGTGVAYASRYEVENAPTCLGCHKEIFAAASPMAETHQQHRTVASCEVCHAQSYKNCASCHVGKDPAGLPFFKTRSTWLDFKIGRNPAPSARHPEKYVVVRHVPVDRETFAFYVEDALTRFDRLPTWKLATPHNIQRKTPQNAACNNCHGTAKLFLRESDVEPGERNANRDVIVPEQQIPARQ